MPTDPIFTLIENDLVKQGYCIAPGALPASLAQALLDEVKCLPSQTLKPAGVGRGAQHAVQPAIRQDQIAWIEPTSPARCQWLAWAENLRIHLNQSLMLGLHSFETHFAHYRPGAFYKPHVDAFKGQANRIVSVVAYLNNQWQEAYGGQLVIYGEEESKVLAQVQPLSGTVVVFLSEGMLHEVKPATVDRYSLAGWFRLRQQF